MFPAEAMWKIASAHSGRTEKKTNNNHNNKKQCSPGRLGSRLQEDNMLHDCLAAYLLLFETLPKRRRKNLFIRPKLMIHFFGFLEINVVLRPLMRFPILKSCSSHLEMKLRSESLWLGLKGVKAALSGRRKGQKNGLLRPNRRRLTTPRMQCSCCLPKPHPQLSGRRLEAVL